MSRLLHEPNTVAWTRGSIVIHDYDAKGADMLMRVTSVSKPGVYKTRYIDPATHKYFCNTTWQNTVEHLHDPERFGIAVPETSVQNPIAR
jgi:hypothetical protein